MLPCLNGHARSTVAVRDFRERVVPSLAEEPLPSVLGARCSPTPVIRLSVWLCAWLGTQYSAVIMIVCMMLSCYICPGATVWVHPMEVDR